MPKRNKKPKPLSPKELEEKAATGVLSLRDFGMTVDSLDPEVRKDFLKNKRKLRRSGR